MEGYSSFKIEVLKEPENLQKFFEIFEWFIAVVTAS
jgi:hypothetical protein